MASIPRIGEDDAYDENDGLHPVWLASNYLRRRKYDECIAICTDILAKNPYDQVRATFADRPIAVFLASLTSLRVPPTPGRVVPEVPRADAEELDRRHRGGRRGTTIGPGTDASRERDRARDPANALASGAKVSTGRRKKTPSDDDD
jgi:hypothetical protein